MEQNQTQSTTRQNSLNILD